MAYVRGLCKLGALNFPSLTWSSDLYRSISRGNFATTKTDKQSLVQSPQSIMVTCQTTARKADEDKIFSPPIQRKAKLIHGLCIDLISWPRDAVHYSP